MSRVEVVLKPGIVDARGNSVKKQVIEDLHIPVGSVRVIDVYTIHKALSADQVDRIACDLLTDPIIQEYRVTSEVNPVTNTIRRDIAAYAPFDAAIEVGYKPGVTDNVGVTTVEGIEDMLGVKFASCESVHTSRLYLFEGDISVEQAQHITIGLLANPLIEEYEIDLNRVEYKGRVRLGLNMKGGTAMLHDGGPTTDDTAVMQLAAATQPVPAATGATTPTSRINVAEVDLDVSDDELIEISTKGVLSLNLEEMRLIRDYFKDERVLGERAKMGLGPRPTDVELEMLAQTWSEHCKHKIFNALIDYTEDGKRERIASLFKTYIRKATEEIGKEKGWLVSVFVDNAGVVEFDDEYNMVFKVETHNHPSALDPYGGAVTGIVGVNRDPMGTGIGSDLIFNTDVFCFGPPDFPYEKLPQTVLHPKRIFKGVRKGVEDGGNKIGIPTVNGAILFDEAYVYNPLVYCGTGGFMPKVVNGKPSHEKEVKPGDLIVMVGGRIGKDGIHGATFSSVALDEDTSSSAVQIGAPIVQRKMQDALAEARAANLYRAITDNGAGGLSSSVGEMSEFSGGCEVDLEKAPTKYPGLAPWELWVSESQERMTVAVAPETIEGFLDLCRRRDVEATVIGKFTDSGKVHIKYDGKTVLYLESEFVHEGLPGLQLKAEWRPVFEAEPDIAAAGTDATGDLKRILGAFNVCSKEWVIRQYDHEVQGASVVKPLTGAYNDGPADAAVIRPRGSSKRGIAVSNGINPKYGEIDTYWMAASAIDEAIRNIVAVGGDPDHIAILDNFCWGNPILSDTNPDGDHKLAQLVRAAKGCYDTAVGLGTPFISGKDSFHNEYKLGDNTIAIPPTLLISAIGIVPDVERAVTMDAKRAGDLVYMLGTTHDELGGSHYYVLHGAKGANVPQVDVQAALGLYRALHSAIQNGLVASAHDCSEGGIAVAAAESAFAGGLGMALDMKQVPADGDLDVQKVLFSESNSRFIVTIAPSMAAEFEAMMGSVPCAKIGYVTAIGRFTVAHGATTLINAGIDELKEAWKAPLRW
ncbi:MAG TPA: phosphoribosylformylglycinamidine synthase subunit PurL [Candidatus Aquicultor sp.]|jgi:phosphoribosylformylglycinamidine synthase